MYEKLGTVSLKDGEQVEAGVIEGPDGEWADAIEKLLGHKGEIWQWQNTTAVRQTLDAEVRFYVLHRAGVPFANMITATAAGAGHFGHVWTQPEDRRKGAARQLMELQMEDFRQRGGKALFLGTGYDSAAYHIYRRHGFIGLEAESGYMDYYVEGREAFEAAYFAGGPTRVVDVEWRHWPGTAALFLGPWPGGGRCLPLGLLGRASTEGAWLQLLQRRHKEGAASRARMLELPDRGAVVGAAVWGWDRQWPATCVVDVFCHPDFWDGAGELLEALPLPDAERVVAYSDGDGPQKGVVLEAAGFKPCGRLERRVALDYRRTRFADVTVWER